MVSQNDNPFKALFNNLTNPEHEKYLEASESLEEWLLYGQKNTKERAMLEAIKKGSQILNTKPFWCPEAMTPDESLTEFMVREHTRLLELERMVVRVNFLKARFTNLQRREVARDEEPYTLRNAENLILSKLKEWVQIGKGGEELLEQFWFEFAGFE